MRCTGRARDGRSHTLVGVRGQFRFLFSNPRGAGCPCGSGAKSPPANAGDSGLIPDPGRSHMPQSTPTIEPVL